MLFSKVLWAILSRSQSLLAFVLLILFSIKALARNGGPMLCSSTLNLKLSLDASLRKMKYSPTDKSGVILERADVGITGWWDTWIHGMTLSLRKSAELWTWSSMTHSLPSKAFFYCNQQLEALGQVLELKYQKFLKLNSQRKLSSILQSGPIVVAK